MEFLPNAARGSNRPSCPFGFRCQGIENDCAMDGQQARSSDFQTEGLIFFCVVKEQPHSAEKDEHSGNRQLRHERTGFSHHRSWLPAKLIHDENFYGCQSHDGDDCQREVTDCTHSLSLMVGL